MTKLAKIDWSDADSSNIQATFFHEPSSTICIRFNNGGLYSYAAHSDKIPAEEIYLGLVHSNSMGSYLHRVIKAFPYTQWDSEDALLHYLSEH